MRQGHRLATVKRGIMGGMDRPEIPLPPIEALKRTMSALLRVPKAAVEEAEAKRVRKASRKRRP